ncbi:MAG: LysM peptidoglycan-binding domain-containing protein [Defluviitaleaceae bacterium]|nr:LysM peptidoglycan-binding domain-containing protein [Defluviitaleaceae bacterium]
MKDFDDNNKGANPEEIESMEAFSRRAVGSLFSDDDKKEEAKKESEPTPPPPASSKDFRMPAEPPYKERIKKDPELEYADYINSAREANRREQEIGEVKKEESKKHIDKQWDEISQISGGKKKEPVPPKAETWDEPVKPAKQTQPEKQTMPHKPAGSIVSRKPMPPVNIGNVAIIGFFVVLIAFAIAMWQAVSVNSRLNYAEAQLVELQESEVHLRTHNASLEEQVLEYRAQVAQQNQPPIGDIGLNPPADNLEPPHTGGDDTTTTQPPLANWANTHRNTAGQLVYTVQAGEGLWGIANRFLGSGTYVAEIVRVNNLPNDQVAEGQEIIIPGL